MAIGPANVFAQLSDAIAAHVAAAAPLLCAIRIGSNRHVSGVVWRQDLIVTSDQILPAQDNYTLVFPGGTLAAAQPARRDPHTGVATLRLETPVSRAQILQPTEPQTGALALALGASADASPTVRLTAIYKLVVSRNDDKDRSIILDLPGNLVEEGGLVLDARGGSLGMAALGSDGQATVVAHALIARMLDPTPAPQSSGRRGWLGVALQPISVPETLRSAVGQGSGRMVVSVTTSGPAELAGLRPSDVLLAMDGHSVSGAHALRTFLGPARVGRQVEVKLLRDGRMETRHLTIAPQPSD